MDDVMRIDASPAPTGTFAVVFGVALVALVALGLAGCGTYAGEGAARGAGGGAIAGAVGGAVTALVFGGDPVEAATRSAVWGASAGAATGAIAGSQVEKQPQQTQQQARQAAPRQPSHAETEAHLEELREEIGEANFAGLEALADCEHERSLRAAAEGRQSKNPDFALAGLWLEILSYADSRREAQARELFPTLVEQDGKIDSTAQAETKMREGVTALGNVREEYGMPRVCVS